MTDTFPNQIASLPICLTQHFCYCYIYYSLSSKLRSFIVSNIFSNFDQTNRKRTYLSIYNNIIKYIYIYKLSQS